VLPQRIYYTEVELSQKSVTGRQKLSQGAKEGHSPPPPELKFQDGARVFQKIIGTRNTCYFAHNSFPLLKLLFTCLYNSSLKDVLVWETFEDCLPIYMALLFIVGVKNWNSEITEKLILMWAMSKGFRRNVIGIITYVQLDFVVFNILWNT
jgi:hypothetical protein